MSEIRPQALDEVRPGMELAEPVLDAGGQVLLPAGIALTEHHLDSLRRRGIDTLSIAQATEPADAAEIARQRERIRARVMHIFRHTADDPGSQALLHAVLAFRLERLK